MLKLTPCLNLIWNFWILAWLLWKIWNKFLTPRISKCLLLDWLFNFYHQTLHIEWGDWPECGASRLPLMHQEFIGKVELTCKVGKFKWLLWGNQNQLGKTIFVTKCLVPLANGGSFESAKSNHQSRYTDSTTSRPIWGSILQRNFPVKNYTMLVFRQSGWRILISQSEGLKIGVILSRIIAGKKDLLVSPDWYCRSVSIPLCRPWKSVLALSSMKCIVSLIKGLAVPQAPSTRPWNPPDAILLQAKCFSNKLKRKGIIWLFKTRTSVFSSSCGLAWSSLVEGCISLSGKLLWLWQIYKNYAAHAWHHSKYVWLLGQSSCSSSSRY